MGHKASATPEEDVAEAAAAAAGTGAEGISCASWQGGEEAPEGYVNQKRYAGAG